MNNIRIKQMFKDANRYMNYSKIKETLSKQNIEVDDGREKKMLSITFKYADALSNWEWRTQHCTVESVDECIRIYGLNEPGVEYEIIEVKEMEK